MRLKCLPFGSNSKLVLHLNTMAGLRVADFVAWLFLMQIICMDMLQLVKFHPKI